MASMFAGCTSLTSIDVSNWDTSNVTCMESMFAGCNTLQALDLSKWDTSNLENILMLFYECKNLTSIDLSGWDTSKLDMTGISVLFYGCENLKNIKLFKYAPPTSSQALFLCPFAECYNITELDLSDWDLSIFEQGLCEAEVPVDENGRLDIYGNNAVEQKVLHPFENSKIAVLKTPKVLNDTYYIPLPHKMYDEDGNEYTTMSVANTTLYAVNPNWSFNIFYGTEQFKGIAFGSKRLYQDITRLDLPWIKQ